MKRMGAACIVLLGLLALPLSGTAGAITLFCEEFYRGEIGVTREGEFLIIRSAIGLAAALKVAECRKFHLLYYGERTEIEILAEGPPAIVRVKPARPKE